LSPTRSRLEDLLVLGSPKNTSKVTILEDTNLLHEALHLIKMLQK